jgi:hypothetical protein
MEFHLRDGTALDDYERAAVHVHEMVMCQSIHEW